MALAAIDLAIIAAGTGGFVIVGRDAGDRAGRSVASAGDINGDGFDDLIVGAYRGDSASNGRVDAGESYVVFGRSGGFGATIDFAALAATAGFVILGAEEGDESGRSVASAGDINGDGYDDIIIGALSGDAAGNAKANAGESYVVFGRSDGFGTSIDLASLGTGGFVIYGQDAADRSGWFVSSAGDVNGDGFDDLIVGSPYADGAGNATSNTGETYVVFGKAGGFGTALDLSAIAAGTGGFVLRGQDVEDQAGKAVSAAGDLNGDGYADLLIGARYADGPTNSTTNAGGGYLVFGGSAIGSGGGALLAASSPPAAS